MRQREDGVGGAAAWCQFLQALPLFNGVDEAVWCELEPHLTCVALTGDGARLFADGDETARLAVVRSGALRLTGEAGPTSTPVLLTPGRGYAYRGVSAYGPLALVAAVPSEVLLLPWAVLSKALRAVPAVRERLITETMTDLKRLQLASTPLFRALDETWLAHVADESQFVAVNRGAIVMREGDESDCLYIVVRGSLELFRERESGATSLTDVLGDGASVGEMGVLTKDPRSLTVRARRDSVLLRISAAVFERVLHQNAEVTLQLASTLSTRLRRTTSARRRPRPMTTIALLRACDEPTFAGFRERLGLAFERAGHRVAVFSPSGAEAPDGRPDETRGGAIDQERLAYGLAAAERAHDYVLCPCAIGSSDWTRWSLMQADAIVVVGISGAPVDVREWPSEIGQASADGTRVELALLRDPGTPAQGTAAWLDLTGAHAHHHLVRDSAPDHDRLVRRLTGGAWGLVLGGGGARGLAHIGVIRALREGGVPIDLIGGTSMGAILAAQYAMGCDDRDMLAMTRRAYLERSVRSDLTLPFVALHSGRATSRRLMDMFGDRTIENLPTPYFCMSCNLTRAQVEVHDRGPVWFWARVSCSVPGLLPPVPYRGDLLVDGGLLDNLPVAEMRRRVGGFVAAVDVSVAVDLRVAAELPAQAPWSGTSHLSRLATGRPRLPNIVDVLMRTAEISSVRDSRIAGSPADLYLQVPVEGIAMTDFASIDRIVALGYDYTARRLEAYQRGVEHQNGLTGVS